MISCYDLIQEESLCSLRVQRLNVLTNPASELLLWVCVRGKTRKGPVVKCINTAAGFSLITCDKRRVFLTYPRGGNLLHWKRQESRPRRSVCLCEQELDANRQQPPRNITNTIRLATNKRPN